MPKLVKLIVKVGMWGLVGFHGISTQLYDKMKTIITSGYGAACLN